MSYSSHARFWRSLAIVTAERSFKRSSQNCNMTLPGSELNLSNPRPRWRWPGISLAATRARVVNVWGKARVDVAMANTSKHVKALTVHCLAFIYLTLFQLLICFLYSELKRHRFFWRWIRSIFKLFVWSLTRGSWFGQDGYAGRVRTFLYLSRREDRDRLW